MKGLRLFHIATGFIAALMVLSGCSSEDLVILSGDMTMVNYEDGVYVSDQGYTYNIVENAYGSDDFWGTARMLFYSDILRKSSGQSNAYDIRLNSCYSVLTKNPLYESTYNTFANYGDDPVYVSSAWTSGGYINLLCIIPYDSTAGTTHLVNLVYENESGPSDKLSFRLIQNAYGDAPTTIAEYNNSTFGGFYFSSPYNDLIPDDVDSIPGKLTWTWYSSNELGALTTVETTQVTTLKRVSE